MVKGKTTSTKKESATAKLKADAVNGKKVSPQEDTKNDATWNATQNPTTDVQEEQEDEVWDTVRVLEETHRCDCRTDDCTNKAVVVWASKSDPADEWPLCVPCQEKDFGGWHEGVAPPAYLETSEVPANISAESTAEVAAKNTAEVTFEVTAAEVPTKVATEVTAEAPTNVATEVTTKILTTKAATYVAVEVATKLASEPESTGMTEAVPMAIVTDQPTKEGPAAVPSGADNRNDNVTVPSMQTGASKGNDGIDGDVEAQGGDEEVMELWELKKVMSIADVTDGPIKCSTDTCTLAAACVYVSNQALKWYSCLDCQEIDYDGWPEPHEIPIQHMTNEHKEALVANCSRKKDIIMPVFTASPSKENKVVSNTVTPLPNGATQTAGQKHGLSTVTPSPVVGLAVAKGKAGPDKLSKQSLEMHRKWKKDAEALGTTGGLVTGRPEAKVLIFKFMEDSFRPMNITDIYKGLKGIVPKIVLNGCLQDMAFDKSEDVFADSDDEDNTPAKKKARASDDPYKGCLCFKAGKSANSGFYYVNYTKTKNNGDGLDPDERNELVNDFHKTTADATVLKDNIKTAKLLTTKFLSEPTNEELTARLEMEESALDELRDKVEEARKLKGNEKIKQQLHVRIKHMAIEWRKRRGLCMNFLNNMEEWSDGTISTKKCLKGDGQIPIESDDTAITDATAYAKTKRSRARGLVGKKRTSLGNSKQPQFSKSTSFADSDLFVGCTLDKQGEVHRVFLEEDE